MRLWRAGHPTRALAALERAVARYPYGAERARAVRTLGDFHFELARYGEAEAVLRRALDEGSTDALVPLAHSQRRQGRFDAAEATLQEAPRTGAVCNALGVVYKETGRFAEAAEQYAAALAASSVDVELHADICHNLAGLAYAQGRFAEAVAPAREALALRERVRPTEVAADVAVLGAVLVGVDELDEAEALLRRAYGMWTRRFGPDHYEAAVCLHNLGVLQYRRGDHAGAADTLRQALRIKQAVLGPAHYEIAALLDNLAVVKRRRAAACR